MIIESTLKCSCLKKELDVQSFNLMPIGSGHHPDAGLVATAQKRRQPNTFSRIDATHMTLNMIVNALLSADGIYFESHLLLYGRNRVLGSKELLLVNQ